NCTPMAIMIKKHLKKHLGSLTKTSFVKELTKQKHPIQDVKYYRAISLLSISDSAIALEFAGPL
ncbi:MAG: hypothetical protein Q7S09_05790, partial [bacterium]|nr:hypothetical protein [bacterium]